MTAFPAFVTAFLQRYGLHLLAAGVVALLIGIAWLYWDWSQARIADLTARLSSVEQLAANLRAADEALRADIASVHRATDAANASLTRSRTRAQQDSRAIQDRNLGSEAQAHPNLLQDQINRETAATFRQLEDLSRNAP